MTGSRRKQTAQSCLYTVTNGAVHPGEKRRQRKLTSSQEKEKKRGRERETRALPELQKASFQWTAATCSQLSVRMSGARYCNSLTFLLRLMLSWVTELNIVSAVGRLSLKKK